MKNKYRKQEEELFLQKRIAVVGPQGCCGTSLVSAGLACGLAAAGETALAEAGAPYFFSAYGFEKKFALRGFTDYYAPAGSQGGFPAPGKALGRPLSTSQTENLWHGVNWAVRPPDFERALKGHAAEDVQTEPAKTLRALQSIPGKFLVVDCSGLSFTGQTAPLLEKILLLSDEAYLVLDPLPGRLLRSRDEIARALLRLPKTKILANRWNSGIYKAEFEAFLGRRTYKTLPEIPAQTIYKSQYACVLPWELAEGKAFANSLKIHQ